MPPSLTEDKTSPALPAIVTPDLTRLPKTVIPKRYELKLDVYPERKAYKGLVNIRLFFYGHDTTIVWLHSVKTKIVKASIRFSQFALPVEAVEILRETSKDCIGIRFDCLIEEGARAWLSIEFSGEISPHLEGFFSTPYSDKNGEKHLGASTMFAATEARSCFPCFDEPEFKAIFALEVTVDEHLMVLSNMPVMDSVISITDDEPAAAAAIPGRQQQQQQQQQRQRRRRTDYFEWTKEMSSYLVCVVIGQYEYLETRAAGRTVVRVYTPWGQREQGRFALEVSKKCLEFFNAYFGKRYPLPKLDLVAVSRLSVGAMENWGIIVCRETGLITDQREANPSSLQNIATLIAHEISHQWFGNLVTMKWWDGLYLNEGFATLMQYICVDSLFPQYEVFNRFCSDTVIPALGLDALQHSHPIEMPLTETSEISQVFDKITYCKGASVIFMLHEFIGADAFKKAIQRYMQQFSYDNATTEDLWYFLSSTSKQDVGMIMNSWIHELGFPVVNASYVQETGMLILTQERFSNVAQGNKHVIWHIPLKGIYMDRTKTLRSFDILFDKRRIEVRLENFDLRDPSCWLKLNPRLTGFYRVHYCEELFSSLLSNLSNDRLGPIDRMGLFDDQVAMVLSEGGSTVRILKMVQLFKDFETCATVWKSVCGILHQIRTLTWPCEDMANMFDQFCLDTLRPVLSRIGLMPDLQKESCNDTMLRSTLFSALACLGDVPTIAAAKELFKNHVETIAPVPPSLRESVFRAVMVSASQQTFQQMLMLYRTSELAEERLSVLQALGSAHDPNILSQSLEFALTPDVHAQEAITVVVAASFNRYGYRLTWNFFVNNLEKILDRYLGTLFLFSKLVKSVTESFCDQAGYEEVADFLASNRSRFHGNEHAVEQAEEHLRLNVIWREKDVTKLQHFLDGYFNS